MVDYIFNRGRDWYGRVDDGGPRRYPDRMKGGDIAQVRRVADRLSPRASFESRTGWGASRWTASRTSSSRACPATGA